MSVGSSSTSRPSTRESQNAAAVESQELVQDEESAQIQSVVAEIDGGAAVEQPEVEQQPVGEGHNGDGDGGINLIREFDPNVHVISDLALRIPFE